MRPWPIPSVMEDPVRLQLAAAVVTEQCGAGRIGQCDLDPRFAAAQGHCHPGERAAGACGADERIDLAVGLPPDLGAGRLHVSLAVGDVVELLRPDRALLVRCAPALRQDAAQRARSCWGSCRGPPGLRAGSRRTRAGCPFSPATGWRESRSPSGSRARSRPGPGRCRCCRRCPRRSRRRGGATPRRSASSTMASAARSFTEPPGLRNSAFPRISQPVCSEALRRRMSGVLPMLSMKPLRMSMGVVGPKVGRPNISVPALARCLERAICWPRRARATLWAPCHHDKKGGSSAERSPALYCPSCWPPAPCRPTSRPRWTRRPLLPPICSAAPTIPD